MTSIATSIRPLNVSSNVFDEIKNYAELIQSAGVKEMNFNFKFVDDLLLTLPVDYIATKLKSIFDKYNLEVTATHAPYCNKLIFGENSAKESELKEKISKAIEISSLLNSKCIVAHSGISMDEDGEYSEANTIRDNLSFYLSLSAEAKKHNMDFALENHVVENTSNKGCRIEPNVAVLCDVCEKINAFLKTDTAGICLDVGHANLSGMDVYEQLSESEGYLHTLHLHNNEGYQEDKGIWKCDTHDCVSNGNINMKKIFKILKDINFNKNYIIESLYRGSTKEIQDNIGNDVSVIKDLHQKFFTNNLEETKTIIE